MRRDNRERLVVPLDRLEQELPNLLKAVHDGLYKKALDRRESMTYSAATIDELKEIADNKPGFIKAMWCGDTGCEETLKEQARVTSRCIPFEQEKNLGYLRVLQKPADKLVVWGKAY